MNKEQKKKTRRMFFFFVFLVNSFAAKGGRNLWEVLSLLLPKRSESQLQSRSGPSISDFEILKPISKGAFGRVFLAKKIKTGDLYAMKILRKSDMVRKNMVDQVVAERDILVRIGIGAGAGGVVRLYYAFQTERDLYLVMEYCIGGDVGSLLQVFGSFEERMARIYIAETILALEYLHS
jgi:serine/threonine protein kinase